LKVKVKRSGVLKVPAMKFMLRSVLYVVWRVYEKCSVTCILYRMRFNLRWVSVSHTRTVADVVAGTFRAVQFSSRYRTAHTVNEHLKMFKILSCAHTHRVSC
jgi:hypothetical protein